MTKKTLLTEGGIYEVLMQSRKPIAKQWKKEVKKILKNIRLNGGHVQIDREEEFIHAPPRCDACEHIHKQSYGGELSPESQSRKCPNSRGQKSLPRK
ncbi:prophage antirepressor-like protein [Bacillus sp. LEw-kw-24]|nr:hypothetical protein [Bacillus sp. LEw-kw-24]MDF9886692.1 prophage antirepressor-like protein [Bacillus sp. LEw-kw-24]